MHARVCERMRVRWSLVSPSMSEGELPTKRVAADPLFFRLRFCLGVVEVHVLAYSSHVLGECCVFIPAPRGRELEYKLQVARRREGGGRERRDGRERRAIEKSSATSAGDCCDWLEGEAT